MLNDDGDNDGNDHSGDDDDDDDDDDETDDNYHTSRRLWAVMSLCQQCWPTRSCLSIYVPW